MKNKAIVVLGAGLDGDSLSSSSVKRLDKAIELFNTDAYLIVSGDKSRMEHSSKKSESVLMKDYALSKGVLKKDVLVDRKSKETIGNILFSFIDYIRPMRISSVTIVTSSYHQKRVELIASHLLDAVSYDIVVVKEKAPAIEKEFMAITEYIFENKDNIEQVKHYLQKNHSEYSRNVNWILLFHDMML